MPKSITPNQIKKNNRNMIYQYIYKNPYVSQQDIAYKLRLSRPTITTNLSALEEDGLITKDGQIDTEYVGRKAAAYTIVADYRVGIGVEIQKKEVKMIAVNLYGEKILRYVYKISFTNNEDYFRKVCSEILSFKDKIGLRDDQILGIGFAIQGLVSPDSKTVLYGKILECTGLSIDSFTKHLPYLCTFIHDADSAAIAELWVSPDLKDAFYLSLSNHLGASLIIDRKLISGDHGHSSTIEHIQMEPGGKLCYCGNHGCMETLCSIHALLNDSENINDFFENVRNKEKSYVNRWHNYLQQLSKSINLLHLIYDKTFILGGYLASYLIESDLDYIYKAIQELTPFPETSDFLQISKMPKHNITIGAALPYIQEFLNVM
jgi:N-acetylglucosamine repressor